MRLQVIHTGSRPVRASSLYCRWIQDPGNGELRAIWMDSEMRAFEKQYAGETNEGALVDEPGASRWRMNEECGEAVVIALYKRH